MTNVMMNVYVSSVCKIEMMKRKLVESIEKTPDAYQWIWGVVAIVAIITVALADSGCRRQGLRWGGHWERNGTLSGSWRVGCFR